MGYEIERFVNLSPDIAQNFKCSICLDIFDDPIELSCGHIFCSVCLRSLFNSGNKCECPECRRKVTSQELKPPHKKWLNVLQSFDVKCDNVNVGCCAVVKLENLQQHTSRCNFNAQSAPSAPCSTDSNSNVNAEQVTILFENLVTGIAQRASRQPSETINRYFDNRSGWRIAEICTSLSRTLCDLIRANQNTLCQFLCVIIFATLLMVIFIAIFELNFSRH